MVVRRTCRFASSTTVMALACAVAPLAEAPAAQAPSDPFGQLQALSGQELSRYRGGFITVAGLEIAISVTVDVNIDDTFRMRTWLTPLGSAPSAAPASAPVQQAGTPSAAPGTSLAQQASNPSAGTGTPSPQQATGAPTSGVAIQGSSGLPVQVSVTETGVTQRIGTPDTTMIETIVGFDRISQVITNTRNHATVNSTTMVAFDLLNHSQRMNNGTGLPNRSLVHLLGNLGRDIGAFRR